MTDVIANSNHSPSSMERRFKTALGRTIKTEITRVKLDCAKLLLQETDLPIATIAVRAGFSESKYFSDVFRKSEQMTATDYRRQFRD